MREAPRAKWNSTATSPRGMAEDCRLHVGVIGLRGLGTMYSGMERVCTELYGALASRGHRITVYSRSCETGSERASSECVRTVPTVCLENSPLETVSHALTSLVHAIRREEYDVIHLHALAPALALRVLPGIKAPIVLTVHGLDWKRARWRGAGSQLLRLAEQIAVRSTDEMIVVSQELHHYYQHIYGRATHLIPNGIDFAQQNSAGDRGVLKRWGLQSQTYVLVVGRLVPEKRVQDVLEAFRKVDADVMLAIIGTGCGPYVRRLRSLGRRDARVVFLGYQSRDCIRELLRAACAFVTASELEGLPMSLLECVAQGVPAVVSDIGPHREVFSAVPGHDLFFPVGDVDQLAAVLEKVLRQPERHKRRALEICPLLERCFSLGAMVDETERVLLQAAGCPARTRGDADNSTDPT